MLSVAFLTLAVLVAIFAYGLTPDNSENANQMHLSIHSKPPGFTVKMLVLPAELTPENNLYTFFFGRKKRDHRNSNRGLPYFERWYIYLTIYRGWALD